MIRHVSRVTGEFFFFLRKYFATQLWFMTYHILYLWHMKSYIISMRYDIIHHIYEICFHMSYIWMFISNYRNFEPTLFWTPKRWRQKKNFAETLKTGPVVGVWHRCSGLGSSGSVTKKIFLKTFLHTHIIFQKMPKIVESTRCRSKNATPLEPGA